MNLEEVSQKDRKTERVKDRKTKSQKVKIKDEKTKRRKDKKVKR